MAMVTEFRNGYSILGERDELDSYYYISKGCKTINNWPTAVSCGQGLEGGAEIHP